MTRSVRGGIGLAAERVALGPSTLVTHAPMHAALRTPSRGSWPRGNALHLVDPPAVLGRWCDAFDRTVGVLPGVGTARLWWELGPDDAADVPDDVAVTEEHVATVHVLEGETDSPALPGDVTLRRADDDRTRAGARSLLLQGGWGKDVDAFRWRSHEEDAIGAAGRGHRWVAYRYGIPTARVGVFHDRDGLAVVDALVTHPLYREQGIGTALVGQAIDALREEAGPLVVVARAPDPTVARLLGRLGFATTGRVVGVGVA